MSAAITFAAAPDDVGKRLDALVAERVPHVSRSVAHKLVCLGRVRINGGPAKPSRRIGPRDLIEVDPILPPSLTAAAEAIPLTVVYRDEDLAVIDKPAGIVVHPAAGHRSGTVANALMALFPDVASVGASDRPGIVHRLDKDTSGLMVVALRPEAHAALQQQITSRQLERRYLALASGHLKVARGTIQAPIGRDPIHRKRMAVYGLAARMALTSYHTLEDLPGFTLLEATLHTGRTHQIRVHFLATGHPLAGDRLYGGATVPALHRQFLHAHRLTLRSPSSGEELIFASALPEELDRVLEGLRTTC